MNSTTALNGVIYICKSPGNNDFNWKSVQDNELLDGRQTWMVALLGLVESCMLQVRPISGRVGLAWYERKPPRRCFSFGASYISRKRRTYLSSVFWSQSGAFSLESAIGDLFTFSPWPRGQGCPTFSDSRQICEKRTLSFRSLRFPSDWPTLYKQSCRTNYILDWNWNTQSQRNGQGAKRGKRIPHNHLNTSGTHTQPLNW